MSDALLIAAHGSRDASGVEEFWDFAAAWQRLRPDRLPAAGFLEFERPTLGRASVAFSGLAVPDVDRALTVCRRLGFERIVVQPYFLFDGILLKRIYEAAARHAAADPGVEIVATRHFRLHPLLLQAFEDRAH